MINRSVIIAVVLAISCSGGVFATQNEPTVSKLEAQLLEKAIAISEMDLSAALALLRAETGPKASAALDFAIGNFYLQQEKFTEAEEAYWAAIEKLPDFVNARKNLGRVYLLSGEPDKAIDIYQKLVVDGFSDGDVFQLLGHGLATQQRFVAAEGAYRQVLLRDADNRDARLGLAKCLLEQERYKESRALLQSLLADDPQQEAIWSLLANVQIALDNNEGAIIALETAQRLGCCNANELGLLGDLYMNARQTSQAVRCYETALAAGWNDPQRIIRALDGFIQLEDVDNAERLLGNIASSPDLELEYLRLRSELLALKGDQKQALKLYQILIERDPLNGNALLRLGDISRQLDETGGAELAYERAQRIDGFQVDALIRRAQLAVDQDQFETAVELLEAAQTIRAQPHVERYLEQVRRLRQ